MESIEQDQALEAGRVLAVELEIDLGPHGPADEDRLVNTFSIEQDLEVMRTVAALAARYWEHGKRLKPLEIVSEYEQTIIDELDLMREAGNAAQLKRNFEGSEMLYVPEIYWDFCRPEVLVQERIHGIPISDMEARAMETCPSSRGWRKVSSSVRGISGISSKNSTPWWAKLTSPG